MRAHVLVAVVFFGVGCGRLLGLDHDDDEQKAARPTDASSDGDAASDAVTSGDGMSSGGGAPGVSSCSSMQSTRYMNATDCDMARFETICNPNDPAPVSGDPCTQPEPGTIRGAQSYCSPCMKVDLGSTDYDFTLTDCDCVQP